jgi:phosphatidylinositol alpha-mannosyltransferase
VKIALVAQAYYPVYGGVTENVHHTALALRGRGHEVVVLTGGAPGRRSTREVVRVGRTILVPWNGARAAVVAGARLSADVRRFLAEGAFDLVHVHCPLIPVLPLLAVHHAEVPVVGTFHATMERARPYEVFRPVLRPFLEKLSARLAVSEVARAFVARAFPGEYRVVPNGVDLSRFHPALRGPAPRDGRFRVLFVGRLDPRKGLDHLVEAARILEARHPGRFVTRIVGDGPRRELAGKLTGPVRSAVRFTGSVPPEALPLVYAGADLVVSPAVSSESFGIVLLEALASGTPVVASDLPGYRTVIRHGRDGLLVPPRDAAALASAIEAVAEDETLRARLSKAGPPRAAAFSWARIATSLEEVYAGALGNEVPGRDGADPAWMRPRSSDAPAGAALAFEEGG